jgi:uncharacterized protein involved in exopolysaccharide biosynthesis
MMEIKTAIIYGQDLQDFRTQQRNLLEKANALKNKLEPDSPEMQQWQSYINDLETGWSEQIKRGRRIRKKPD